MPTPTAKVREHSKELIRAFTPIRFFLMMIGQMPFDIKKKVSTDQQLIHMHVKRMSQQDDKF